MSNIERRYAYLDEGVFPEEGEYGVTYLTLYSSNAGNTYDGWVYDPDNKVRESLTARTYGYRNPDYPQYCWDDEVVVDLSNAQSRQESSEYIQGRITSFNTNVSDRPIVLQDIDITGLTEEERENRATTVLFSAIPLVQDAYIQAQVEVQCKCNLSPDNTSGEMRIEAFYILNDESDRTMRPNPVHTFTVSSPNERHTLPWLYWNPALRHEDHNYIGVKLICTGGTAEIGISDNPDYGDAMITLASAGLTGDKIDDGHPVSLEIFGREEVVGGYELDPDDYTVLCTYNTGEIYEVTRMCTFSPAMGTAIIDPITTLTAYYMGLQASMTIRLGLVESIELTGVEDIYEVPYTLNVNDYVVLAYLDNGDILDVTSLCEFSPAMGTEISSDTTLIATYEPYWMPGASFTDSLNISLHGIVNRTGQFLIYTLYNDGYADITGRVPAYTVLSEETYSETLTVSQGIATFKSNPGSSYTTSRRYDKKYSLSGSSVALSVSCPEVANYPISDSNNQISIVFPAFFSNATRIEWKATGKPVGIHGDSATNCEELINFDKINVSEIRTLSNFLRDSKVSDISFMRSWRGIRRLYNISGMFANNSHIEDFSPLESIDFSTVKRADYLFDNCKQLTNLNALSHFRNFKPRTINAIYHGCTLIRTTTGINHMDWSDITSIKELFYGCQNLLDLTDCDKIDLSSVIIWDSAFRACESLRDCGALADVNTHNGVSFWHTFSENQSLTDATFVADWDMTSAKDITNMFFDDSYLDVVDTSGWNTPNLETAICVFSGCMRLNELIFGDWNPVKLETIFGFLAGTSYCNTTYAFPAGPIPPNSRFRRTKYQAMTDLLPLNEWDIPNLIDDQSFFASSTNSSYSGSNTFGSSPFADLERVGNYPVGYKPSGMPIIEEMSLRNWIINIAHGIITDEQEAYSRIIHRYVSNMTHGVDPEFYDDTGSHGIDIFVPMVGYRGSYIGTSYYARKAIDDKLYLQGYVNDGSWTMVTDEDYISSTWHTFVTEMQNEYNVRKTSEVLYPTWLMNSPNRKAVRITEWNRRNSYPTYTRDESTLEIPAAT